MNLCNKEERRRKKITEFQRGCETFLLGIDDLSEQSLVEKKKVYESVTLSTTEDENKTVKRLNSNIMITFMNDFEWSLNGVYCHTHSLVTWGRNEMSESSRAQRLLSFFPLSPSLTHCESHTFPHNLLPVMFCNIRKGSPWFSFSWTVPHKHTQSLGERGHSVVSHTWTQMTHDLRSTDLETWILFFIQHNKNSSEKTWMLKMIIFL